MLAWLLICALAATAGALFGRVLVPPARPSAVQRAWSAGRAWRARRVRRPEPDPFATLRVQLRLAELHRELDSLLADTGRYARAHHLRAAQSAYEDQLALACRLAGVEGLDDDTSPAVHRLLAENALRARGWTW